jgi:3-phenylpropionate/trans-cinnamate dioxygenase ferredoxin component
MADFLKVARVEEIEEGATLALEADGELVCLAKVAGCIHAFTDNCTHISGPLNQGELAGYVLTCPWHGAQFDVRTGKVVRGPARQDILTYPVKVEDNAVFIQLPDEE